jgi:dihydroxyacetone kinase-like predicted kinase
VRNASTTAGPAREGDALGLVGDEVVVIGREWGEIVEEVVRRLHDPRHEILTVFWGDGVSAEDASRLERRLRECYADLEIELHDGGQPGYPYLIGLE